MKQNKNILIILFIIIIGITSILIINNLITKEKGELKKTTYKEVTEKIKNKEDFILIISQSTCSHCATYKPKVKTIAEDAGITVYYLDYDTEKNPNEVLDNLKLTGASPITLFFKEGKESSVLNRIEGDLSSTIIKEKFKKMGFINE